MKFSNYVDILIRHWYEVGKFGKNTPDSTSIFREIEHEVVLNNIKRVNGNGILRQAERAEKILKAAK